MYYPVRIAILIAGIALIIPGCIKEPGQEADYSLEPVPFTSVNLKDSFWAPRIKKSVAVPMAYDKNTSNSGFNAGIYIDKSEILRIIEGASYSLQTFPDIEQELFIDTLISKSDFDTSNPDMVNGADTPYYYGHLFDAASAHYLATGKRTLLNAAIRCADNIIADSINFRTLGQQGRTLSGLINLFTVTGEKKYIDAVKLISSENKSDIPPAPYNNINGQEALINDIYRHAALAGIAALTNDSSLTSKTISFWKKLVYGKMQITGGIGLSQPVAGAGFYDMKDPIPSCELCASVADIILNHNLFLIDRQSKYYDIIERIFYNSVLPCVSATGEDFTCINPIFSDGRHERNPWADGPSCRSEIVRLLPSIPGYIYSVGEKEIYLNLFISNDATVPVGDHKVSISVREKLPWEGKVEISVDPEAPAEFSLKIRIPGWASGDSFFEGKYRFLKKTDQQVKFKINGGSKGIGVNEEIFFEKGFAVLKREWAKGDKIEIEFPMSELFIEADKNIIADTGRLAVQRGPLIYCAEWTDNSNGKILNLVINDNEPATTEFIPGFLNGTQVIRLSGYQTKRNSSGGIDLLPEQPVTLIPYPFYNNRGPGPMQLWLPVVPEKTRPLPAATIAFRSRISGNSLNRSIISLNDQIFPDSSNDTSVPHYDWWPLKSQWVWVQYDFSEPRSVSGASVYWFDNGPEGEFRVPDEWEMLYLKENIWTPVKTRSGYPVEKNSWNTVTFSRVTASSVKIKALLQRGYSGGLYEWIIE